MTLTSKQHQVLTYIEQFEKEQGYPPTFNAIREHFGFSSLGTVYNYVRRLKDKGYLLDEEDKERHGIRLAKKATDDPFPLPVLGTINAGVPSETFAELEEVIDFPRSLLPASPEDFFVLRVRGESMIDKAIKNGDLIICRRQSTANNGEVVVASIDGERTLKEFWFDRQKKQVELRPYNSEMSSIWVGERFEFHIEGILHFLLRRAQ